MSNCGIIRNLIFRDKVDGILNTIFGTNNYEKDNISAQIAYRFPELNVNKDTATKPIGNIIIDIFVFFFLLLYNIVSLALYL